MPGATAPLGCTVTLTGAERAEIIRLLNGALAESRVEVHRTHTPEYRERVIGEETLLRGLLEKFQNVQAVEPPILIESTPAAES